jgi:hypothetical protein
MEATDLITQWLMAVYKYVATINEIESPPRKLVTLGGEDTEIPRRSPQSYQRY